MGTGSQWDLAFTTGNWHLPTRNWHLPSGNSHLPSAKWHIGILACTKWELACMMLAQVPEAHLCYLANTEKPVFQIKWLLVPRDPASFLRDTHHVINIQLLFGCHGSDQP